MKNYMSLLLCFLMISVTLNAQSKKELEAQVAQLTTDLEASKASYSSLSATHDSTTAVLDTYIGMYKTIQEKVLPYDFAPEDIGRIIDSLTNIMGGEFVILAKGD